MRRRSASRYFSQGEKVREKVNRVKRWEGKSGKWNAQKNLQSAFPFSLSEWGLNDCECTSIAPCIYLSRFDSPCWRQWVSLYTRIECSECEINKVKSEEKIKVQRRRRRIRRRGGEGEEEEKFQQEEKNKKKKSWEWKARWELFEISKNNSLFCSPCSVRGGEREREREGEGENW